MPLDDLVSAANKATGRAKIQGSTHLDQRCPRGKRPLKMSLNSWDNQTERAPESGKTPQGPQDKANQAEQGTEAKKFSEKARKEKKKKNYQRQCKRPKNTTTGANAALATGGESQKKKRYNGQGPKKDIFEVTYYNYNKKGYYSRDCTKLKN